MPSVNVLEVELRPVGWTGARHLLAGTGGRQVDVLQVVGDGGALAGGGGVLVQRAVDADAAGQQDDPVVLVGLGLEALDEHQRPGAALFLENVEDLELPRDPAAGVGRSQELPVAAAVQAVAVEGQGHLEVRFLSGAEVPDGRRDVLPRRQRRADDAAEPAGLGGLAVHVQRVRVLGGVGQVVDHLLADGEPVALRFRLRPDEGSHLVGNQAVGQSGASDAESSIRRQFTMSGGSISL